MSSKKTQKRRKKTVSRLNKKLEKPDIKIVTLVCGTGNSRFPIAVPVDRMDLREQESLIGIKANNILCGAGCGHREKELLDLTMMVDYVVGKGLIIFGQPDDN